MKKRNKGFTIVEIMIVVAIIGLLAAVGTPNYLKARERVYYAKTSADIRGFQNALQYYCEYVGTYPETLDRLILEPVGEDWAFVNVIPTDWFGYNYEYKLWGDGIAYSLRSVGADGIVGTEDDIEVW